MKFVTIFDPKTDFDFLGKSKLAALFAVGIPLVSLLGIFVFGMNWGIDFTGGTEMQIQFQKTVQAEDIRSTLESIGFEKNQVQSYGAKENNEYLIRVERMSSLRESDVKRIHDLVAHEMTLTNEQIQVSLSQSAGDRVIVKLPAPKVEGMDATQVSALYQTQKQKLAQIIDGKSGLHLRRTKAVGERATSIEDAVLADEPVNGVITYTVNLMGVNDKITKALSAAFGEVEVRKVEFVDSQVSKQLRTDGLLAVIYALVAILIYIVIRFDIFFAPGAILGLVHDTVGALLVYAFFRYEFDLPSIAALLTIVGHSINNTIVIYDRIRTKMPPANRPVSDEQLREIVNKAINDTFSRTVNTSLTVIITSMSLFFLGGAVIKSFALTMAVGITLGAFASTFIAPAVYIYMRKNFYRPDTHSKKTGLSREDKARGVV